MRVGTVGGAGERFMEEGLQEGKRSINDGYEEVRSGAQQKVTQGGRKPGTLGMR